MLTVKQLVITGSYIQSSCCNHYLLDCLGEFKFLSHLKKWNSLIFNSPVRSLPAIYFYIYLALCTFQNISTFGLFLSISFYLSLCVCLSVYLHLSLFLSLIFFFWLEATCLFVFDDRKDQCIIALWNEWINGYFSGLFSLDCKLVEMRQHYFINKNLW